MGRRSMGVRRRGDSEERDSENGFGASNQYLGSTSPQVFGDLSPEALNYIQRLQSELTNVKEISRTSRDYLAKVLFWCMLLGHHLRGLENRLHLSCVVGLL
ncbi:hypothetical protein RchiOBHm_Chr4g0386271 [Rosa chinensis]|uniref:Uncharacterized protein n=1 Tax=Rosa chinensis TaxID=74649 RepID=A0A2P6QP56_ROSCH|nr:hypothetical protein RchiOBHm_Chr4g0386271 [Rosa chinensis]